MSSGMQFRSQYSGRYVPSKGGDFTFNFDFFRKRRLGGFLRKIGVYQTERRQILEFIMCRFRLPSPCKLDIRSAGILTRLIGR